MSWFKKNWKNALLTISLILNALGGTGTIPPVVGKTATGIINALPDSK